MGNYKDILNEWYNCISSYPKLKFKEARQLYIELSNCSDNKLKSKLRDDLILNTLYVVFDFIKNNGLIYLNSSSYDMSDIISVCNEIWINKINSGALLSVKSFGEMFDSEFYNRLSEGLNITKFAIGENTIIGINTFMDLLMDYIKLKDNDIDFNFHKLIEFMKENRKYQDILYRIYNYDYNINFCNLFDAIIESFELGDCDLDISKTKLEKLRYIIISNGLEYLRRDINRVVVNDTTDTWIRECARKQIVDYILNESGLSDIQIGVIVKRYGLLDGKYRTLEEVAKDYGVTRERIRQREAKTLRMLRNPTRSKRIKELM